MDDTQIVILAGGKGTRMKSDLPKVLVPLGDKPMIRHLLDSIDTLGCRFAPLIVVGYEADMVKNELGDAYTYVTQAEQLGTGHAVMQALGIISERNPANVLVLYGDMPFVSPDTIRTLAKTQRDNGILTMATTTVPDFEDWRSAFERFGRIVRDDAGNVTKIVEYKDATSEERAIHEVNPSYFCFDTAWMAGHLTTLGNDNAQGEYYLTDLVERAFSEGQELSTVSVHSEEALGANSREDLERLESVMMG